MGHLQRACSAAVLALTDISQDVTCPASARGLCGHNGAGIGSEGSWTRRPGGAGGGIGTAGGQGLMVAFVQPVRKLEKKVADR